MALHSRDAVTVSVATRVVSLRRIRDPKSVRLKDRDYDVTPNIIAHMYPQIRNGSVKECEVEMVGEECEVYCEDGRRRGPWVGAR